MRHTVPVATSPLNCRWIRRGSRGAIEGFEYAVCGRVPDAERVVNEAECKFCPAWEPPRSLVLCNDRIVEFRRWNEDDEDT